MRSNLMRSNLMRSNRIIGALLTAGAAVVLAVAPIAHAAVDTGSAGTSCANRTPTDYLFLQGAGLEDLSCATQDDDIQLARSDCQWLDDNGSTSDTRADLAQQNAATVAYPFTLLTAAINTYCPENRFGL